MEAIVGLGQETRLSAYRLRAEVGPALLLGLQQVAERLAAARGLHEHGGVDSVESGGLDRMPIPRRALKAAWRVRRRLKRKANSSR